MHFDNTEMFYTTLQKKDIKDKEAKTGSWRWTYYGYSGQRLARRRRHRSSAVGETHANETGELLRSMGWTLAGDTINFGYGASGALVPDHAEYVEFFNGDPEKPNRPTLQNTITKTEVDAMNFLEEAFEKKGLEFDR